mmetsp:Transcript_50507/g.163471  ORF Transcript_50507/g.163471 Transcript_50507/m.163471 type:complete len:392 (-) Transcript_50507:80-1255(-)
MARPEQCDRGLLRVPVRRRGRSQHLLRVQLALHRKVVCRLPLGLVRVEQRGWGALQHHQCELPRQVRGVLDAKVAPSAAEGAQDRQGFAAEEQAALLGGRAHRADAELLRHATQHLALAGREVAQHGPGEVLGAFLLRNLCEVHTNRHQGVHPHKPIRVQVLRHGQPMYATHSRRALTFFACLLHGRRRQQQPPIRLGLRGVVQLGGGPLGKLQVHRQHSARGRGRRAARRRRCEVAHDTLGQGRAHHDVTGNNLLRSGLALLARHRDLQQHAFRGHSDVFDNRLPPHVHQPVLGLGQLQQGIMQQLFHQVLLQMHRVRGNPSTTSALDLCVCNRHGHRVGPLLLAAATGGTTTLRQQEDLLPPAGQRQCQGRVQNTAADPQLQGVGDPRG